MSQLRLAVVDDAAQIAAIDVRAWWHGYREFLDEQRLSERDAVELTGVWAARLAAHGTGETWVLEVAGRVAGYVSLGPSRDADADAVTGEVYALYVDPPAQGAGAGTRLLENACARLRERGFGVAVLWTFEQNGLGRAFYERYGWLVDAAGAGGVANDGCESWAPAVRYKRSLDPA